MQDFKIEFMIPSINYYFKEETGMQRMDLTHELYQQLKEKYFNPFIKNLERYEFDNTAFIANTFCILQIKYANSQFDHNTTPVLEFLKKCHYYFKENLVARTLKIQNKSYVLSEVDHHLFSELEISFKKLGLIYLDQDRQRRLFPAYDAAQIQTAIREIFHDHLNPLPHLKMKNVDNKFLHETKQQLENNGILFAMPNEIQQNIYSFLDYESKVSFKRTCSSAYFLHKAYDGNKSPIFYFLGDDIKITRARDFFEFDLDIALKSYIPKEEIISSFSKKINNKAEDTLQVFPSLYQVLEFASSRQHGGHLLGGEEDGYMPSLWVGAYHGNPVKLNFSQEKFTLNENRGSSSYGDNRREACVSYANVPKHSIVPLLGTLIYPSGDFASYRAFNTVDFRECKNIEEDQHRQKKSCSIL